jgi:tRNA threonylcarbamoyladenosine biosynthesis protein TsaE
MLHLRDAHNKKTRTVVEKAFITNSAAQTRTLGRRLGQLLDAGDWIGLSGDLGAGKTCFTQGIARGLGVDPDLPIVSPTFVIVQNYPGRIPLRHMDLYRVNALRELDDIGYEELYESDGVCVVEWCERVKETIPQRGLLIMIEIVDARTRRLILQALDQRGRLLIEELAALSVRKRKKTR